MQQKAVNKKRLELEKDIRIKQLRDLGVEEHLIAELEKFKLKST